jgi:lysophospholipase L1-like esterase
MGNALPQIRRALALLQTAWSILGVTLGLIVLMECAVRLGFALKDRLSAVTQPDPRVLAEGYGGAAWLVDHYRELESLADRWEPYAYFRQKPFRGTTITIGADGLRSSWQPPTADPGARERKTLKLLTLGGSSLWGFGARDDQTIPSLLARGLFERGWSVELKNLSEVGYVSTQELVALLRELQAGYRPDVVVFYDGVNDTASALLEGKAGLTTNEGNRRREFNLLQSPARLGGVLAGKLIGDSASYRLARALRRRLPGGVEDRSTSRPAEDLERLADDVVRRYAANLTLADSLGRGFGFRSLFYWQPVLFTKRVLVPFEREEVARFAWLEGMFRIVLRRVRASAELKANPAFHDLGAAYDDAHDLVFIDYCHTTESANQRIAQAITDDVIEAMNRPPQAHATPPGSGGSPVLPAVE